MQNTRPMLMPILRRMLQQSLLWRRRRWWWWRQHKYPGQHFLQLYHQHWWVWLWWYVLWWIRIRRWWWQYHTKHLKQIWLHTYNKNNYKLCFQNISFFLLSKTTIQNTHTEIRNCMLFNTIISSYLLQWLQQITQPSFLTIMMTIYTTVGIIQRRTSIQVPKQAGIRRQGWIIHYPHPRHSLYPWYKWSWQEISSHQYAN